MANVWKKLEIFCMSYFIINTQLYNKFQRYLRHVTFYQLPELLKAYRAEEESFDLSLRWAYSYFVGSVMRRLKLWWEFNFFLSSSVRWTKGRNIGNLMFDNMLRFAVFRFSRVQSCLDMNTVFPKDLFSDYLWITTVAMPCGGPKSLPAIDIVWLCLHFLVLWDCRVPLLFGNRVALNPVSDVASAIISHEQTQSNRVCCFQSSKGSLSRLSGNFEVFLFTC